MNRYTLNFARRSGPRAPRPCQISRESVQLRGETDTRFLCNNTVTCEAVKCKTLLQAIWAHKSPFVDISERVRPVG